MADDLSNRAAEAHETARRRESEEAAKADRARNRRDDKDARSIGKAEKKVREYTVELLGLSNLRPSRSHPAQVDGDVIVDGQKVGVGVRTGGEVYHGTDYSGLGGTAHEYERRSGTAEVFSGDIRIGSVNQEWEPAKHPFKTAIGRPSQTRYYQPHAYLAGELQACDQERFIISIRDGLRDSLTPAASTLVKETVGRPDLSTLEAPASPALEAESPSQSL
jgi:hypothetical protein